MAPIRSSAASNPPNSTLLSTSTPTITPNQTEEPSGTPSETQQSPSKKRKKKQKPHILYSSTIRTCPWTYLHLSLLVPSLLPTLNQPPLDPLTARTLLTPPLSAFLGLTGSSIPADILHTDGLNVWLRIPQQDGRAFRAALAGWMGSCEEGLVPGCEGRGDKWGRVKVAWRIVGEGRGLGGLIGGDERDIFGD